MNLTGDTMAALQAVANLLVREHAIPAATDQEHMPACPARHLDLSPVYPDFHKEWELVEYLGTQVSNLTNGALTVRTANRELLRFAPRTPDILILAVCNGSTPMDTVVNELTDETRLLTLQPYYGGLNLHLPARPDAKTTSNPR